MDEARRLDVAAVLVDDGADVVEVLRGRGGAAQPRRRVLGHGRGRIACAATTSAATVARAAVRRRATTPPAADGPATRIIAPPGRTPCYLCRVGSRRRHRAEVGSDALDLGRRRILLVRQQIVGRHRRLPDLRRPDGAGLAGLGNRGRRAVERVERHPADDGHGRDRRRGGPGEGQRPGRADARRQHRRLGGEPRREAPTRTAGGTPPAPRSVSPITW